MGSSAAFRDSINLDLFENSEPRPPIARASDPATSKLAAAEYSSTSRQTDCEMMLELVRSNPGCTAGEYGDLLLQRGLPAMKAIRMPTKRLSDLKHAGEVIAGASRVCTVSGRLAATYTIATCPLHCLDCAK